MELNQGRGASSPPGPLVCEASLNPSRESQLHMEMNQAPNKSAGRFQSEINPVELVRPGLDLGNTSPTTHKTVLDARTLRGGRERRSEGEEESEGRGSEGCLKERSARGRRGEGKEVRNGEGRMPRIFERKEKRWDGGRVNQGKGKDRKDSRARRRTRVKEKYCWAKTTWAGRRRDGREEGAW
ncbi:hypothetical protein E2C01_068177 [Portunus trituberculatus]|uniref:Uncharacterized protein n=1 Tax=Portunus trituberculatus TaxID=210409 RepID=A0A5B7HX73_PORTR|nr:hypothetical protein [Portunus trituberculatus]